MPSLVSSLLIMPAFFPCAWLEVLFVGVRKFQQVFQECPPPLLQVPAPLFTSLSFFVPLCDVFPSFAPLLIIYDQRMSTIGVENRIALQ